MLHKLDAAGETETEIVQAKYMLGCDGWSIYLLLVGIR